jgi:aspartyl-tRNA(Asn)/glutamyl-tRNA(Gln) amidotransferase subunit A
MDDVEQHRRADSVIETAEAVRRGDRTAIDVVDECLARIEAGNEALNAFVYLDPDGARARALEIDEVIGRGHDPGPLAGVPFGVKDLEDCAGMPTSHGSLLYQERGPIGVDSVHVRRLRAAGAIPLGKTAAPEFGTLHFTKTKAWGVTGNAWDPSKTPGGSRGGSAAAVASGMVPFCTASDGGGSTRIPASFSGLFGLKPSQGRIPHPRGTESQTAVLGALVTSVTDAARHLDVAAGPDDHDRTSLPPPGVRYEDVVDDLDVGGLRVAWSSDLGFAAVDPEVREIAESAAEALIGAAALEPIDRAVAFTDPVRVWLSAGALDLWLSIDERRDWPQRADDFTAYVRYSLEGTVDRSVVSLVSAKKRRWLLEEEVADLFEDIDVLLTPTTAVPAFPAAGPPPDEIDGRAVDGAMSVPFTMLANLCWNPAASVPAGVTASGLPVGLQIVARRHRDDQVLRLARLFEQARPWSRHAPAAN